jgi:hypothetical protein
MPELTRDILNAFKQAASILTLWFLTGLMNEKNVFRPWNVICHQAASTLPMENS